LNNILFLSNARRSSGSDKNGCTAFISCSSCCCCSIFCCSATFTATFLVSSGLLSIHANTLSHISSKFSNDGGVPCSAGPKLACACYN